MPKLDREGIFRAAILNAGLSEGKDGKKTVMANFMFEVESQWDGQDWKSWPAGYACDGNVCLVQTDGTPMPDNVVRIVEATGWNADPAQLNDGSLHECRVMINVVKNEYKNKAGAMITNYRADRLRHFNSPAESGISKLAEDRLASLTSTYGRQFKSAALTAAVPTDVPKREQIVFDGDASAGLDFGDPNDQMPE